MLRFFLLYYKYLIVYWLSMFHFLATLFLMLSSQMLHFNVEIIIFFF